MLTGYIAPDERFVTCPNQDVVYATGWFDLSKGPIVFQVPDFGDRFWVYALYDGRTDEFSKIGKQYDTKPGFYLIEKVLGRRPVRIGADGKEVFVYRGDVANRAIQLAGIELQMFTERKEIKHSTEFDKMSDVELVQLLEQEAQALLLSDQNEGGEDGNGDPGA